MFTRDVLQGKVALVVGGSANSGPAICEVLARHGADVALTYRTHKDEAGQVAKRCRQAGGHEWRVRAETFPFDLLEMEQVHGLVPAVVGALGRLDILLNLGGPYLDTSLRDLSPGEFDIMMDGHVKGCFFLAREAAKHMEASGGGLVVNISALSSLKYGSGIYGLVKACVNEMTRFLAHTFAPEVRVINLIPGLIELPDSTAETVARYAEQAPLKRLVTPEQLALLVIAAASPAFQSITGESLIADAGSWMLHPG